MEEKICSKEEKDKIREILEELRCNQQKFDEICRESQGIVELLQYQNYREKEEESRNEKLLWLIRINLFITFINFILLYAN